MRRPSAPPPGPSARSTRRGRLSARSSRWVFAAGVLALWAAAAAPAAPPEPGIQPGSIIRWAAAETDACGLDGLRFLALDGACYYPIDLLRPEGNVELVRWSGEHRETATVRVSVSDYPIQRLELPRHLVELTAEDRARVDRENREIARLWGRTGERQFGLPLSPPLDPLPQGGRFGVRRIINGVSRGPHSGADFGASSGVPVLAVADGEVALVGEHFFGGRSVFLDHGDGLITMYMHLSEVDVTTGEHVSAGQRIGAVGATGRAQGPHLHFGVRWHGARVDPTSLLGDPTRLPEVHQVSRPVPRGGRRPAS
jgi:hypothetical protein